MKLETRRPAMVTATALSAVVSLTFVTVLLVPPADCSTCRKEIVACHKDVLEARLDLLETKQNSLKLKYHDLQDEVSHLRVTNNDLETQVNLLKNKNMALDVKLKSLTERTKSLETQMNSMSINMSVISSAFENLLEHEQAVKDSEGVSFQARSSISRLELPKQGSTIVLDNAITNQGNGYNTSTGVFTVPINGTYFFLANTWDYWQAHRSSVSLVVDNQQVAFGDTSLELYYQLNVVQALVVLNAGQKVWLKTVRGGDYYMGKMTAFSGFLIHQSPCQN